MGDSTENQFDSILFDLIHRCVVNLLRHSQATHLMRRFTNCVSVMCIILR